MSVPSFFHGCVGNSAGCGRVGRNGRNRLASFAAGWPVLNHRFDTLLTSAHQYNSLMSLVVHEVSCCVSYAFCLKQCIGN